MYARARSERGVSGNDAENSKYPLSARLAANRDDSEVPASQRRRFTVAPFLVEVAIQLFGGAVAIGRGRYGPHNPENFSSV